jgi:glycosyltransferase involved in cell wall biosynthesis
MNILWIPHTSWRVPQRAHLFCRALAERHTVHVTDWAADFTRPADFFSRRYLRNVFYRRFQDGNITVHGVPRLTPAIFSPTLRRFNTRLFANLVARLIAEYRIDVVVGTFVCPPPQAPRLIFDWFDDNAAYWRAYGRWPAYADEIETIEQSYLQRAEAVVAVSSVLAERARQQRDPATVHWIPNGVERARYQAANGDRVRRQLGIASQQLTIGFVSALGEFSGLTRLLQAFSMLQDERLALLVVGDGPQLLSARAWVNRHGLKNVFFTGKVPFSEVPDYMAALQVGVLPFDKTPFTEAASPIKIFEYSAAGLPVVSTDLEEVRRMAFPNVILVEDNPESLAQGICQALHRSKAVPPQIEQYDIHYLARRYEEILTGNI